MCKHNYKQTEGVPSDGCGLCVAENAEEALKIQNDYFEELENARLDFESNCDMQIKEEKC